MLEQDSARPKFRNTRENQFMTIARARIDRYFEENHRSRHADLGQKGKGALLIATLVTLYFSILSCRFSHSATLGFCCLLGLNNALLGMNIAHDAAHQSYSRNNTINRCLSLWFDFLGANSFIWKKTHNNNHHTYTNISGQDTDLKQACLIRLDPHARHFRFHRFQHLYIWPAYALIMLNWMFYFDFRYVIDNPTSFTRFELSWLALFKLTNLAVFLVIPAMWMPVPFHVVLLGYLAMQLCCGLFLSIVFAMAHLVEAVEFPLPDASGTMPNAWGVHQLRTTCDFAPDSGLATLLLGGLNFQIEHHLFPNIAHCHYPAISRIVKATALELGLPFHEYPSFGSALRSHVRTLRRLGTAGPLQAG